MYLGQDTVSTDASGDADLDVLLNQVVPESWFITATARSAPATRSAPSAIARATGVGRETAKSRLRYATARLRQALSGEPSE